MLAGYGVAGLVGLAALILTGMGAARPHQVEVSPGPADWSPFRFGFVTYALVFLAFDMEMAFMYPWAVVFADIGLTAFFDMFAFIAILLSGLIYVWGLGGFRWE